LDTLTEGRGIRRIKTSPDPEDAAQVPKVTEQAMAVLEAELAQLDLPFKIPAIELWAILWPMLL
jgi:hypothetical protein